MELGSALELLKVYWAFSLEPSGNTGKGRSGAGIQAKGALGLWGTRAPQLLLFLLVKLLQLSLHIFRYLHLQQVFHANLWLIANKHLQAEETGEQLLLAVGTSLASLTLHSPG